jgi:TPR repeat protein
MYSAGEDVPKNYETAVKWYTKAAKQGYADAQYLQGKTYDVGMSAFEGCVRDYIWNNLNLCYQ